VHTERAGYAQKFPWPENENQSGFTLSCTGYPRDINEFSTSYPQNVENICSPQKKRIFLHFPHVLHIFAGKLKKKCEKEKND
jgi:hypothetical protein